jgi:hypothetical protein
MQGLMFEKALLVSKSLGTAVLAQEPGHAPPFKGLGRQAGLSIWFVL